MITGQLENQPLPAVLLQLYQEHFTGQLAIHGPDAEIEIYLREGYPVQVEPPDPRDLLGVVLHDMKVLGELEHKRSLAIQPPPGKRYGDMLLMMGMCDEATLVRALRVQVRRKLLRLFSLQSGGYVAVPGEHGRGLQRGEVLRVHPYWVAYHGTRTLKAARLQLLLAPLHGKALRLREGAAAERALHRFGLGPAEERLIQLLQSGELGLRGLCSHSGMRRGKALALIYSLMLACKLQAVPLREREAGPASAPGIDENQSLVLEKAAIEGEREDPGEGPGKAAPRLPPGRTQVRFAPAAAPSKRTPPVPRQPEAAADKGRPLSMREAALLRAEIVTRQKTINAEGYHAVLGVAEDATPEAVEAAHSAALQRYDADLLAAAGLAGQAAAADQILKRVHEAYEVLGDPQKRQHYEEERRARASWTQAAVEKTARAELHCARGQVLIKYRDFHAAAREFTAAVDVDPARPELPGYLAWARFSAGQVSAKNALKEIITVVRQAQSDAHLFYFAGVLFRVEGHEDRALQCFARALRLDGTMSAAASEIRVLQSRRERQKGGKPQPAAAPRRVVAGPGMSVPEDADSPLRELLQTPVGGELWDKLNRPIGEVLSGAPAKAKEAVAEKKVEDAPAAPAPVPVAEQKVEQKMEAAPPVKRKKRSLVELLRTPIDGNLMELLSQPIDSIFPGKEEEPGTATATAGGTGTPGGTETPQGG